MDFKHNLHATVLNFKILNKKNIERAKYVRTAIIEQKKITSLEVAKLTMIKDLSKLYTLHIEPMTALV